MAFKILGVAFGMFVATSTVLAASPETGAAPTASADAKYCMHIEAITGSRLEKVKCWTRAEWAEQGVDVDKEWSKEGVAVIN